MLNLSKRFSRHGNIDEFLKTCSVKSTRMTKKLIYDGTKLYVIEKLSKISDIISVVSIAPDCLKISYKDLSTFVAEIKERDLDEKTKALSDW